MERKNWVVNYSHKDGRHGTVNVMTEIDESKAFNYGNNKCGLLTVGEFSQGYDLRYNHEKDLHMVMMRDYFGDGLVSAIEV